MSRLGKIFFNYLILLMIVCSSVALHGQKSTAGEPRVRTLVIFFDGLRPDYITPEAMPHLYAFSQTAFVGKHHHSVFPTVTRVNSASYATGSYPASHGLMGNSVFFPQVNPAGSLNTSYADLQKVMQTIQGPLLTSLSLGEILKANHEKMFVFSSGTTGQAYLQNHTVNGAIINPELILPESIRTEVEKSAGVQPTSASPKSDKHRWITDAFLQMGIGKDAPLVSAIWYSDPDGAAHSFGMGSPQAQASIHEVDTQFGRVINALKSQGISDQYNIIISTDHGFVTHTGKTGLMDFLISKGFKKDKTSEEVVVADGAIYVKDKNPETIRRIVESLHEQDWVGAVFTRASPKNHEMGWVKGTLSFNLIHWNHPDRSSDILVAVNWNDLKNEKGYAGSDFARGVAGHGGSSPYEININLFGRGPSFKTGQVSHLPTSNVDIVPTILAIYRFPQPEKMDGRVIHEMLKDRKFDGKPRKGTIRTTAAYPWGVYQLSLERSLFEKFSYIHYTRVERTRK